MSAGPMAVPKRRSTVIIEGTLPDGVVVKHEMPMYHSAGAQDGQLMVEALKILRTMGGMVMDGPAGTIDFYPLFMFKKIHFSVARVSLAMS